MILWSWIDFYWLILDCICCSFTRSFRSFIHCGSSGFRSCPRKAGFEMGKPWLGHQSITLEWTFCRLKSCCCPTYDSWDNIYTTVHVGLSLWVTVACLVDWTQACSLTPKKAASLSTCSALCVLSGSFELRIIVKQGHLLPSVVLVTVTLFCNRGTS